MLPFDKVAEIKDQGNVSKAQNVPVHIELTGASAGNLGESYDYEGEVPGEFASELVRTVNRKLVIDGVSYKVIQAEHAEYVPHVALRLLEVRSG